MKNIAIGFEEEKTLDELKDVDLAPCASESPCSLTYNDDGSLSKIVYGDIPEIDAGQPFFRWSETLLRDDNGKVIGILTKRPGGNTVAELFQYDDSGKFIGTKIDRHYSNSSSTDDPSSGGEETGGEEEAEEEEEE